MLFSTPLFLLLFMPLVVTAYVITPRRGRNAVLLAASLLFYAWGEPEIIFVILTSAILDFMLGRCIAAGGPRVSLWLLLGIGTKLGLLFVFKYAGFLLRNVEALTDPLAHLDLVLPLGISFVVFEKITYLAKG
jgi:alginate O-acetyltransferase complex protein AlgI